MLYQKWKRKWDVLERWNVPGEIKSENITPEPLPADPYN